MFHNREDPYRGLAVSVVTSNPMHTRDAFDLSVSWHTTAGSSSTFTYQVSNATSIEAIAEKEWSNVTSFFPSVGSYFQPPLGFRYARILRSVSGSSLVFAFNKTVSLSL